MREFDFAQKLAFSEGFAANTHPDTIRALITGCVRVERAELIDDKSGIDYFAYLRRGARLGIDLKTREPGCSQYWFRGPELALENWSSIPTDEKPGKVGWTLDEAKATDYTLHVFDPTDTTSVYLMPFQLLRMAFRRNIEQWQDEYKGARQGNNGWISSCIFVPACVVIEAVVDEMQGELAIKEKESSRVAYVKNDDQQLEFKYQW